LTEDEVKDTTNKERKENGEAKSIPHGFFPLPLFRINGKDSDYYQNCCDDDVEEIKKARISVTKMQITNRIMELIEEPPKFNGDEVREENNRLEPILKNIRIEHILKKIKNIIKRREEDSDESSEEFYEEEGEEDCEESSDESSEEEKKETLLDIIKRCVNE
jgi:hypothetical protein